MRKAESPVLIILFSTLLILQSSISAFGGISFTAGQGLVLTGADGLVLTGADGLVLTGADSAMLTGSEGLVLTGADGLVLTGADALTYTGEEGLVLIGADSTGIRSFDPELAWLLNTLPDTSAVNVFVVFYSMPGSAETLETFGNLYRERGSCIGATFLKNSITTGSRSFRVIIAIFISRL